MSASSVTRFALVDVNSCFAACERIFNPSLIGKPVVVLSNNDGCVIARSAEAQELGIPMGEPWFRLEAWAGKHGVEARSSNYELYGDISERIMNLLCRFAPVVEQYSIDEAFVTLTGTLPQMEDTARRMRAKILHDLGMPVSVGIARTRTLAKLANHGAKQVPALDGVAVFDYYGDEQVDRILESIPAGEVWGVGRRSRERLAALGIDTARQLRETDPEAMRKRFNVTMAHTILELRGTPCIEIGDHEADRQQVMFSRSFSTPVTSPLQMQQVLSIYAQNASRRLRAQGGEAGAVYAWAQTARMHPPVHTASDVAELPSRSADPVIFTKTAIDLVLPRMREGSRYVRAGVCLSDIRAENAQPTLDLFDTTTHTHQVGFLVDQINRKLGRDTLGLGLAGVKSPTDWQMKREFLSKRATTHWAELVTVHAH